MSIITYLTHIRFGHGAVCEISDDISGLGIKRALVVSDKGVTAAGLVERVAAHFPGGFDWILFDDVPSNPTERAMAAAVKLYRQEKCDGLVAIGGGSPIDLAKAVALMATHAGPLADFALIEGGLAKITSAVAPVIAVPTTAGTGSEVGRGSLMTLDDGRKLGIISPHLIPKRAICDPDLTEGLPAKLTAATGMDALTHCIETYLLPKINPPADAIALDGAARAWQWIEEASANGGNKQARFEMMMAALEGGMTFQKGLGAVHSMSHPLGGIEHLALHHGTLNAVILPSCMRFNEPAASEKFSRLRAAMGLAANADIAAAIEDLVGNRLGLPTSLAGMGVTEDILPAMVKGALADHSTATNPRTCGEHDFHYLFNAAMLGW